MIDVMIAFLIALWLIGCIASGTIPWWNASAPRPWGWPWLIPLWPLFLLWDEGVMAWYRLAAWRRQRRVMAALRRPPCS